MIEETPIVPPKLATRFFRWYCCDALSESILGDLQEQYLQKHKKSGALKANIIYWVNVITFINRHTLKNRNTHSNHLAMFRNYILVAFRNLMRNRAFSAINIFGLAIGIASCLVIFLYVRHELSFDHFHKKSANIYRITNTFERTSGSIFWARTPPALAPAIRSSISGIDQVTRMRYAGDHTYEVGDRIFNQGNVFFADSLFLDLFDFELKSGDRNTILNDPNSIAITEEMATKYFGDDDPIGRTILFDHEKSLIVTGVFKSVPTNSHISFDMLISFETFQLSEGYLADLNSWVWAGFHTYALLNKKANLKEINQQVLKLYNDNFNRPNITISAELQPLTSIYLESGKYTHVERAIRIGNRPTIYGLGVVAILILVIAGANFMNLSTAVSLGRGKEIGVRKVMGADKGKVVMQFLLESVIVSILSLMVGMGFIIFGENYFENQLGIEIGQTIASPMVIGLAFLCTLLIGVCSGFYPSLILSSFKPIAALKGNLKTVKTGAGFRNSLVVFQFIISLLLIAGSMVIVIQMDYIKNKSLGFDKENVIKLQVLEEDMNKHGASLKNRFLQHSNVLNVSISSHAFEGGSGSGPAIKKGASDEETYQLVYYQVDQDFLDLLGIELVSGRFFSKNFPTDTAAIILNQTAVDLIGLENPIGEEMSFARTERKVIGVVDDFHISSMHHDIAPMAIVLPFGTVQNMLVKLSPGVDLSDALIALEQDWQSIVGTSPFDATFLDDQIQEMYSHEEKLASLINLFSTLAVVLACLGLYGLVAFSVKAKMKEIGIRKILGATIPELLLVLSKNFVLLILIAFLVAMPLIYYLGNMWLANFAYRIDIPWWIYLLTGISLLLIALITISHQTISAARSNPSNVLKDE
ncbi:MAG: ABC transporter permease [Reichenbachiella sp.]